MNPTLNRTEEHNFCDHFKKVGYIHFICSQADMVLKCKKNNFHTRLIDYYSHLTLSNHKQNTK